MPSLSTLAAVCLPALISGRRVLIAQRPGAPSQTLAVEVVTSKGNFNASADDTDGIESHCEADCAVPGGSAVPACMLQCRVGMYKCIAPDKAATKDKCMKDVNDQCKEFKSRWAKMHNFLILENEDGNDEELEVSQWVQTTVHGRCTSACGSGLNSTQCVPGCQEEMYWCASTDPPMNASSRDSCFSEVEDKYHKFSAEQDVTHSYVALHTPNGIKSFFVSTRDQIAAHDSCVSVCGKSVDSSCVPECQVKMYWCLDHDPPLESDKRQTCMKDAESEFKKFGANWDVVHPYLLLHRKETTTRKLTVSNDLKTLADGRCKKACGVGVDSSCMPECQVGMYWCMDHDPPYESDKRDSCMKEVEDKYSKFGAEWDAVHPYLLLHTKKGEDRFYFSAEEQAAVADRCEGACGVNVDSSCVPECQVKMYWCLDHDPPLESDKRDTCMNDAEAEFKKFGANWDAVHPYLFQRRESRMKGHMTV